MAQQQNGTRVGWIIGASVVVILTLAWIDGGEEPVRPIETAVALPGAAR